MQYTENYQLPQWAEDDRIMMGDFNRAMADIDRGIAEAAKDLGTGGKNARIAWGTYKGNGKYGASSPNTLTFDFTPAVVFIAIGQAVNANPGSVMLICGVPVSAYNSNFSADVRWMENGVQLTSDKGAYAQYNDSNTDDCYAAIGFSE